MSAASTQSLYWLSGQMSCRTFLHHIQVHLVEMHHKRGPVQQSMSSFEDLRDISLSTTLQACCVCAQQAGHAGSTVLVSAVFGMPKLAKGW